MAVESKRQTIFNVLHALAHEGHVLSHDSDDGFACQQRFSGRVCTAGFLMWRTAASSLNKLSLLWLLVRDVDVSLFFRWRDELELSQRTNR